MDSHIAEISTWFPEPQAGRVLSNRFPSQLGSSKAAAETVRESGLRVHLRTGNHLESVPEQRQNRLEALAGAAQAPR